MEDVPQEVAGNNGHDNGRLPNGQFAKGNPGKRPGSQRNKLRDEIKSFLSDRWPEFNEWFNELKPNEKVRTYLELLPFGVSKLQTVAIEENEETKDERLDLSKLSDQDLDLLEQLQNKMKS